MTPEFSWIATWKLLTLWPAVGDAAPERNTPTSCQVTSATGSAGLVVASYSKYSPAAGCVATLRPAWKSCQNGARRGVRLRNSLTLGEKSPAVLESSQM